jgi:hypothetical protein
MAVPITASVFIKVYNLLTTSLYWLWKLSFLTHSSQVEVWKKQALLNVNTYWAKNWTRHCNRFCFTNPWFLKLWVANFQAVITYYKAGCQVLKNCLKYNCTQEQYRQVKSQ